MSHFCPHLVPWVHEKWWGQILDKAGTLSFFHFLPGDPAAGQKVDNIGTLVPNLSPSCPGTYSFYIYLYFTVFYGKIDAGQKLDNCPRFVLILSNLMPWPWPTCGQTGPKQDKLTHFCPDFVFSIPTLKFEQMLDKIWTFVLYYSNDHCAAAPIFPTMFQSPMFS